MRALIPVLFLTTAVLMQANIVFDPGFESAALACTTTAYTGSIDGSWSATAGSIAICDSSSGVGVPHSGDQFAYLGWDNTPNALSQTLTTTPGQEYEITFWLAGAGLNPTVVTFGTDTIYDTDGPTGGPGYQEFTAFDTASSSSTVISFTSQYKDGEGVQLDDVTVDAVPEPGTFGLLGISVAGVGLLARRGRAS